MLRLLYIALLGVLAMPLRGQETVDLTGTWDVSQGDSLHYDDYLVLPGSLETGGKPGGRTAAVTWYRREVYVPQGWHGQRVSLFLERPLGATTVFVNGIKAGRQSSLFTPHQYTVSPCIKYGTRNRIEVCVADTLATVAHGLTGRLELRMQPSDQYVRQVRLYPLPFQGTVLVDLTLGGHVGYFSRAVVGVLVQRIDKDSTDVYEQYFEVDREHAVLQMEVGNWVALWDEFHPNRYRLAVMVGGDYYETTFGMYDLLQRPGQLMTNHRPLYLRGITDQGHFPKTGYAPTDEDFWRRRLQPLKDGGINYVRFDGYCPPEAAFSVADALGLMLQPGLPSGTDTGEAKRVENAFANHPSYVARIDSCLIEIPRQTDYKTAVEQALSDTTHTGFLLTAAADSLMKVDGWKEYCNAIVPLAQLPKTHYAAGDTLTVPIAAYNAYYGDLERVHTTYFIHDDSMRVIAGGQIAYDKLLIGQNVPIGSIALPLTNVPHPCRLTLVVQIAGRFKNRWEFWVDE